MILRAIAIRVGGHLVLKAIDNPKLREHLEKTFRGVLEKKKKLSSRQQVKELNARIETMQGKINEFDRTMKEIRAEQEGHWNMIEDMDETVQFIRKLKETGDKLEAPDDSDDSIPFEVVKETSVHYSSDKQGNVASLPPPAKPTSKRVPKKDWEARNSGASCETAQSPGGSGK